MAKNDKYLPQEGGDDLSELDGIFSKEKKEAAANTLKKNAARESSKEPSEKSSLVEEEKGTRVAIKDLTEDAEISMTINPKSQGAYEDNNQAPISKVETFFEQEGDNDVARAKRSAQVDKIIKSTRCKKAVSDLLSAVDLDREDNTLRSCKIGEPYAELVDRLQMLLKFNFNMKTREISVRAILELLLLDVVKDLESNGGNAKLIRMLLEKKIMSAK